MSAEEIRRLAERLSSAKVEKERQSQVEVLSKSWADEALNESEQRCKAKFELIAADFSREIGDLVRLKATAFKYSDSLFAIEIDFQSDLCRIPAAISEKEEVHGSWNSSSHGDDFNETGRTNETLCFAIVDGSPSVLKCRHYTSSAWRLAWKENPETSTTYSTEKDYVDTEAFLAALYEHVARKMSGSK